MPLAYVGWIDAAWEGLDVNCMKNIKCSLSAAAVCLSLLHTASAAIIGTGDVSPTDPSTWTNDTQGHVGLSPSSTGAVTVFDGSHLLSRTCRIGSGIDATGTVDISGSESTWVCTDGLSVGYAGHGELSIVDGGVVSSLAYGDIGFESGATGVVSVAGQGSTWDSIDELNIGGYGDGQLHITDGGTASANTGYISRGAGSRGTVVVSNSGSTWNAQLLDVGKAGDGYLIVSSGGTVNSVTGYVGTYSLSKGVARVSGAGSRWSNSGDLTVGDDGDGQLSIADEGLVVVGGELAIDSDLDGDGSIRMGCSAMLAVAGDAGSSLAGFLDLIEGTDAIQFWDSASSSWSTIVSATPGADYTLEYHSDGDLTGCTVLTVISPWMPGDADLDSDVDLDDFVVLKQHFATGTTWCEGDFDVDGDVDLDDFVILKRNFGATTNP